MVIISHQFTAEPQPTARSVSHTESVENLTWAIVGDNLPPIYCWIIAQPQLWHATLLNHSPPHKCEVYWICWELNFSIGGDNLSTIIGQSQPNRQAWHGTLHEVLAFLLGTPYFFVSIPVMLLGLASNALRVKLWLGVVNSTSLPLNHSPNLQVWQGVLLWCVWYMGNHFCHPSYHNLLMIRKGK